MVAQTRSATSRGSKRSWTSKGTGGKERKKGRRKPTHVVYQEHHPDRERWPDYTIRLRRNHHLFIWRQIQSLRQDQQSYDDIFNLWTAIEEELGIRLNRLGGKTAWGEYMPQSNGKASV